MQRNKIYKKSFRQNRAAQYNERRQEKQARLYDSGKSGRRTGKVVLTPCASFRTGISLLWERPRRFALGTRPARCRCRILQSRERRFAFPSGWGRLYCGQAGGYLGGTPLRSATASAFLPTPGTPCACCRRRSRAEPPDADQIIDRYPDGG